ncbi:MAG: hypothetical protein HOH66_13620 [Rhodospirillaceae bacterium]|nr:hypothetical protein [Rhodospirillaceae bacterium]
MTRVAGGLLGIGLLASAAGCMDEKYTGLTLDPARPGQGYGTSMNKSNPGRAETCETAIGICRLDPNTPTARTFGCGCFATDGQKVRGTAQ